MSSVSLLTGMEPEACHLGVRMRKGAVHAVVFLLAAEVAVAATEGGPISVPLPLFPANNWWSTDISSAPVDPNSANFITFINNGSVRTLHPDFGANAGVGYVYGFPYIVVDSNQTKKSVLFNPSANESDGVDHNTNTSFPFYPVPDEAITSVGWIEDGPPGNVDDRANSDRHMLMVDTTHNWLYELYSVFYDGANWTGASGAFFDMNSNNRRTEGWTSADAAGLAILPGLVRYDEVSGPNEIRHALRVTMRTTNGYVYPASHVAGNSAGALPMGARLRLKASKDISGFTPDVQKIFRAFKKYGLIVADNGTDMYVSGTYDTHWDNSVLNPQFAMLSANDFEVVKRGWRPARGDFGSDGNSDVVWRNNSTGGTAVWTMNGTTVTTGIPLASPDPSWKVAGVADFDGDGKPDILWRNSTTGDVGMWLMNGTSLVSATTIATVPNVWQIVGVGDVNNDNKADVFWWNGSTGDVVIWLMNGASPTGSLVATVPDLNWHIVGVGDFNGDGRTDVFWRNMATGENGIWLMNGTSIAVSTLTNTVADLNYQVVGVGDMNGDGRADVIWRRSGTGEIVFWLMNGAAPNGGMVGSVADANWRIDAVGDFDGDGQYDLLWHNASTGDVAMWLMNGLTIKSSGYVTTVGDLNWAVTAPK